MLGLVIILYTRRKVKKQNKMKVIEGKERDAKTSTKLIDKQTDRQMNRDIER